MENILLGGRILKIKEFPKKVQDLFALLHIVGKQNIIGSAPDNEMRYSADYDLNSHYTGKMTHSFLERIQKLFLSKLSEINKKKNVWFSDLKVGEFRGVPLRWDIDSIRNGKIVKGCKITFLDALMMPGIIKMDILAVVDGVLTEITENYTFELGKYRNQPQLSVAQIASNLLEDEREFMKEGNILKAMKRKYKRLLLEKKDAKERKRLLEIFNSPWGKLGKLIADLRTMKLAMDLPLPPKRTVLQRNWKHIETQLSSLPFLPNVQLKGLDADKVEEYAKRLEAVLNEHLMNSMNT